MILFKIYSRILWNCIELKIENLSNKGCQTQRSEMKLEGNINQIINKIIVEDFKLLFNNETMLILFSQIPVHVNVFLFIIITKVTIVHITNINTNQWLGSHLLNKKLINMKLQHNLQNR